MSNEGITFDKVPEALGFVMAEVSEIKSLVMDFMQKQSKPKAVRTPVGVDRVCEITGNAKSTIYALVRNKEIPCYKSSKKLYFYEDELLDWINSGKRKTNSEIREEVISYKQKR